MKVYLNNQLVDRADAKISVFDHGFLYGDGIFEGIRLYNKRIFKLDEHLERLEYSAKAIMLDLPWSRQQISDAVCEVCRANNLQDGYIRLVISRGIGALGLNPKTCKDPQLVIIADKLQLYPKELYKSGLKIITVPTRRINSGALPPMIKSLNYLNNILAKVEAVNLGFMEAVMLNDQGYISECTGDNIFIMQKDMLLTPLCSDGALRGISRETVIQIAEQLNIAYTETNLTRYDLWTAQECFLTGTAAEIIPVVEIDSRKIGEGKPGETTARFIDAFQQKILTCGECL
jgi:branched-chain amino acid aminotransferase